MSQEPEKKETEKKNPAERFDKVNRKKTVVWTGIAVALVLALALGIYFAGRSGSPKAPEGSGSAAGETAVVINDE